METLLKRTKHSFECVVYLKRAVVLKFLTSLHLENWLSNVFGPLFFRSHRLRNLIFSFRKAIVIYVFIIRPMCSRPAMILIGK